MPISARNERFYVRILHQVAAMEDKVSSTLTKRKDRYKKYVDKLVWTLPTSIVKQQAYVNHSPTTLNAGDKKTSAQYNKLLFGTVLPFDFMDFRVHVITVNKKGIPNTRPIDRATPVPTRKRVTKPRKSNFRLSSQITVPRKRKTESTERVKCIVDEVLDHCNTRKDVLYKV